MDSGHRIEGVWCASITPLDTEDSIDGAALAEHVRWLLDRGCHGVAVFGSTGEANSFSIDERIDAVARLAEQDVPMHRILVGAGASAYPDVLKIANAATRSGAYGLLLHPPYYYRNANDDGLFAFFSRIVDSLGPSTPRIVLYHFPKLIGVGISEDLLDRLVGTWPESIVGIKDSSGDFERMRRLTERHPGLSVLAGTEKLLLPLLNAGGAGCLTASANLTSRLARTVYDHRQEGDQARLAAVRGALETLPFVPGLKRILADHGGRPEWHRIRPPLQAASESDAERLYAALADLPALPNLD